MFTSTLRRTSSTGTNAYRLAAPGGGKLVDDDVLAQAVERVAAANGGQHITVFEILTAVAFVLFSEHPADAVIMEVGLGGRFDATNVIPEPAVSLIMPVLDRSSSLSRRYGRTDRSRKAGIIKKNCPVVIGFQLSDTAREVLVSTADRLDLPCFCLWSGISLPSRNMAAWCSRTKTG